jgi:hypothetical protein
MTMSNQQTGTALVPIDQREIEFYEDRILAALVQVGDQGRSMVYVPVRPICEYLGVDWSAQRQRINREPVLSKYIRSVVVITTRRGAQEMLCLPVEFIHGWLFGVSAARVKPDLRDKLIRYQEECFHVLSEAFQADTLAALPETPTSGTAQLLQIRETGLAIVRLAEQQLAFEENVTARLDKAGKLFGQMDRRVSTLERWVTPGTPITDPMAAEVSQKVMALAALMTEHEPGKNHYQGIFGELHRRFGVTSYKFIPMGRYEEVLTFLDQWRKSVVGNT